MRGMKGHRRRPASKTVRAEAGAHWGEFDAATPGARARRHRRRVSDTGIAGLALGSGSGWLERKFGFTCDNLLGAEMVTADGRVVRRRPTRTPTCSGAAGRRRQLRGRHRGPAAAAPGRARSSSAACSVAGADGRRGRALLARLHGDGARRGGQQRSRSSPRRRPTSCRSRCAATRSSASSVTPGRSRTASRRSGRCASSARRGSTCSARCPTSRSRSSSPANPQGGATTGRPTSSPSSPTRRSTRSVEHATSPCHRSADHPRPRWWRLARVRRRRQPSAAHARSTSTTCRCGRTPPTTRRNIAYTRAIAAAMKPWTTGQVYLNFIGDEGLAPRRGLLRRREVRPPQPAQGEWDPDNLFRHNQNIKPATPG